MATVNAPFELFLMAWLRNSIGVDTVNQFANSGDTGNSLMIVIESNGAEKVYMLTCEQASQVLALSAIRMRQLAEEYEQTGGKKGIKGVRVGERMWLLYRDSVLSYATKRRPPGRPRSNAQ